MTSRAGTVARGVPRAYREVKPIMALTAPRPSGAIGAARRAYRLGRDRSTPSFRYTGGQCQAERSGRRMNDAGRFPSELRGHRHPELVTCFGIPSDTDYAAIECTGGLYAEAGHRARWWLDRGIPAP